MSSSYRLNEVPSYESLRKIEDWSCRDREKGLPHNSEDTITDYQVFRYALEKEMYRRDEPLAKALDPQDDPELGTKLMRNELGFSSEIFQVFISGVGGTLTTLATGDPSAAMGGFIGTYLASEGVIRGSGLLWSKGRDRSNLERNSDFTYNETIEEILEEPE